MLASDMVPHLVHCHQVELGLYLCVSATSSVPLLLLSGESVYSLSMPYCTIPHCPPLSDILLYVSSLDPAQVMRYQYWNISYKYVEMMEMTKFIVVLFLPAISAHTVSICFICTELLFGKALPRLCSADFDENGWRKY